MNAKSSRILPTFHCRGKFCSFPLVKELNILYVSFCLGKAWFGWKVGDPCYIGDMIPLHPQLSRSLMIIVHFPLPISLLSVNRFSIRDTSYVYSGTESHYNYWCVCPQPTLIATPANSNNVVCLRDCDHVCMIDHLLLTSLILIHHFSLRQLLIDYL